MWPKVAGLGLLALLGIVGWMQRDAVIQIVRRMAGAVGTPEHVNGVVVDSEVTPAESTMASIADTGLTSLFAAIRAGDGLAVASFPNLRALVNRFDEYSSPLDVAIHSRHHQIVSILLRAGADPNLMSPGTGDAYSQGTVPLTLALGDFEMVSMLLEAGANPEAIGSYNGTVLTDAMDGGDQRVVSLLRFNGAKVPRTPSGLAAAAGAGEFETVRDLLSAGLDPNDGGGYKGEWTPLSAAAQRGDAAMLDLLLSAGADPNRSADSNGRTPLGYAIDRGHAAAARRLIAAGARLAETGDYAPEPALHAAVLAGRLDMVQLLLAAGADPCVRYNRRSAVEVARSGRIPEIVNTLSAKCGSL